MLRTFLYTLFISLFAVVAQAQVKDSVPKPLKDTASAAVKDSLRKGRGLPMMKADSTKKDKFGKPIPPKLPDSIYLSPAGIRIGLDVSRFAIWGFQPYRKDVTVQADIRVGQKTYAAIETGWNKTSHSDSSKYIYNGSGIYSTIGIDYDFMKKRETNEQNMLFAGIRYGFAHNTYEVPYYLMSSTIWDAEIEGSHPKTTINSHWVELVFGLRIEVMKNLFLSWGVREKIMISRGADEAFPPIVIPGFGSGSKSSQFDMTYTVSYMLPLYKVKVHVPREQPKK